jgi:signal transduction histidine kinase
MRAGGIAVCLAGLAAGLVAEYLAFGWDSPLLWLPDLAVGLTLIGSGAAVAARSRGAGVLLAAAGFAWFAGTLVPVAVYWHRGPLIHLLVTYPGARSASRTGWVVVLAGYASALAAPLWRRDGPGVALALTGLGLAVVSHRRAAGRRRHDRRIALQVVAAFSGAVVVGAVVRLVVPAADAADGLLLVYEALLIAAAVRLVAGLRPPAAMRVVDLVVELGEGRSEVLREAFAGALRDPTVRFGYWQPARSAFVDGSGAVVAAPIPGDGRVMTTFERDGQPLAALVHDAAVLTDPALARAVAATTRLTSAHAELEADVRHRVEEVAASARRMQIAADEERGRLEGRLASGPEASLRDVLRSLQAMPTAAGGHLERAAVQLDRTLIELHDVARGLHPRELDQGLAPALTEMAEHSPVPVRLMVDPTTFPPEIATAVYYVCAEALANATKHARASAVSVTVESGTQAVVVTVSDDGIGGADPTEGTGLAGLTDRVAALGGRLRVGPATGGGTVLTAEIPAGGP